MSALVHIGEVGLHHAGGSLILRPSLLAMSRLGTPAEIVQAVAVVFGEGLNGTYLSVKQQLRAALEVWQACAPEGAELDKLTGYFATKGDKWVKGRVEPNDLVVIAQMLLRHGVLGDPEPPGENAESPRDDEYEALFDCRKYAAMAMGHLAIGERDAWNMTMTGLRLAIEAKYPKQETPEQQSAKRAPTLSEYDATMEWFDKVKRVR